MDSLELTEKAINFIKQYTISCLDVGSHVWQDFFNQYIDLITIDVFEPDEHACAEAEKKGENINYHPFLHLGKEHQSVPFYLTKESGSFFINLAKK